MPDQDFSQWIGRSETQVDWIVASRVAAWHATLDHDLPFPAEGSIVPPAVYWTLFPPLAATARLSEDGHPHRGEFLPPVRLPRRMWAGSRLAFHLPLRIGDRVTRESTIAGIDAKDGRQGPLVFVTVRHIVRSANDVLLEEEQDIVYRDPVPTSRAPSSDSSRSASWESSVVPGEALLFRYSALTFNSHRIHYDRAYAELEGYPGLVVHGPLIATLLLDLVRTKFQKETVNRFAFKAVRPAFDGAPLRLRGTPSEEPGRVSLWSVTAGGQVGVEASAWIG
jgi:3-methylfumaryl-CoA hydratase